MKQRVQISNAAKAKGWARRLTMRVKKVLAAHPHADPDNVRHTLIKVDTAVIAIIYHRPPNLPDRRFRRLVVQVKAR